MASIFQQNSACVGEYWHGWVKLIRLGFKNIKTQCWPPSAVSPLPRCCPALRHRHVGLPNSPLVIPVCFTCLSSGPCDSCVLEGVQLLLRWGCWLSVCGFQLDLFDCWTCLCTVSCPRECTRKRGKRSFGLWGASEPGTQQLWLRERSWVPARAVKASEPPLLHWTLVHFYLVKSAIVHIAAMYC